jgi:hypothetical protein
MRDSWHHGRYFYVMFYDDGRLAVLEQKPTTIDLCIRLSLQADISRKDVKFLYFVERGCDREGPAPDEARCLYSGCVERLVEVLKTTRPYWANENELSLRSDEDMAKWPTDDMFATWGDNVRHTLEAYCGAHLFWKPRTEIIKEVNEAPGTLLEMPLGIMEQMTGDETAGMQQEDGKAEKGVMLWKNLLGEISPVEAKRRRDRVLGDEIADLDIPSDPGIPVCGRLDSKCVLKVY